jgi:hypothetical protein
VPVSIVKDIVGVSVAEEIVGRIDGYITSKGIHVVKIGSCVEIEDWCRVPVNRLWGDDDGWTGISEVKADADISGLAGECAQG